MKVILTLVSHGRRDLPTCCKSLPCRRFHLRRLPFFPPRRRLTLLARRFTRCVRPLLRLDPPDDPNPNILFTEFRIPFFAGSVAGGGAGSPAAAGGGGAAAGAAAFAGGVPGDPAAGAEFGGDDIYLIIYATLCSARPLPKPQ